MFGIHSNLSSFLHCSHNVIFEHSLNSWCLRRSVCVMWTGSTEGSQAHPAHGHACASTEPHKLQWEPWEVKQGEVTKRACWPIPCKHRLPWEHIDYLTIWTNPVPCTCQGSVGVFVALLSRGSAAKWVLCGATPPGHDTYPPWCWETRDRHAVSTDRRARW